MKTFARTYAILPLLALCASALAVEPAHEEAGGGVIGALGLDPRILLTQLFAFILLYLLFRKYLWGPVLNLLEDRQEEVATIYGDAEQARSESENMRRDYEARLARADEESRERLAATLAQANAMKDEIIASAREQAERIVTTGRESVRMEAEKAQAQIRDTAARMAVDLAGRIIQREMDPAAQSALVDRFLDSAGGAGAGRLR